MLTAFAAATLVAVPAGAPPSEATSTYLCTGYSSCNNAGYSHAGYAAVSRTMYWRMYGGHNCTNYVAYRMIKNGMPNVRPWSGSGNATNWGVQMSEITDSTPAVGAVAWWRAGVAGAGSSGHVAYIEKVVSPTEIVISEDSWSGDFHWRTIYKNGPGWPSGFIHFTDKQTPALTATATPRIDGSTTVGGTLRGFLGRFAPAGATQSLQWLADGAPISGATSQAYSPTAADVGKTISLRSTGSREGYTSAVTTSTPTEPISAGALVRVGKPTIDGDLEVGAVLTVVPGEWSPAPESSIFRWRADGVWLGATRNGRTLSLTDDLVGKSISVVEVTKRTGFASASNASNNVGPVVAGVVELTAPFRASGTARNGSTLTFSPGTWTPADAAATYEWSRDGVVVPGVSGATYALGAEDVGRRITVRAAVSRERYQGLTRSADFGVVTTTSKTIVHAGGRKLGAIARVRITAPGVAAPTGTIWARIGEKVVRGTVVDGVVELKLENLSPGTKTMLVLYAGNEVVEQSRAYARVVVKPKK